MAPSSALPIGASRVISEMQPVLVDPTQSGSGLLNSVLALLPPKDEKQLDDTAILESDVVVDYIHSTAIDIKAKQMTVLSPAPGALQGRIAIMGTLEWQE
ncbi:hypothetical protein Clacol_006809 [Clathrus columnatus]|uniref:Clp1 C-terminal domain-containing protein n=1 Tax=Clathrus columnatus TaxID=1419009 RepID=A0AAV5AHZ3_9AGAM|nr:hypothetical protein Clacol_006809 [Clathrus columnatus]